MPANIIRLNVPPTICTSSSPSDTFCEATQGINGTLGSCAPVDSCISSSGDLADCILTQAGVNRTGTCVPSAGSVATCTFVARGAGTCEASQKSDATFFSYSMGASPTEDGGLLKSIACRAGGIWAAVPDSTTDALKRSLEGFYAFWSATLAHSSTTNVIWSEPYTYSGTGFLGTTVSAAAFDRSDPANPRFIGGKYTSKFCGCGL